MKRFHWHSMSLSRRVLLLLSFVLVSAAVQITIAQLQHRRVFRPMEENAEQIQTISQFLHQTEKCIETLEEYHWEYGDAVALSETVQSCLAAASDHLSSLRLTEGAASENALLLLHAVRTTYPYYTGRLAEIEQALTKNEKAAASRLYYDEAVPCGQYLAQYSRELLEQTILDSHDLVFSLTSTSQRYSILHLAGSMAALLATVLLALHLRSLLFSISQLSKASQNISEGNFLFPDVDDRRQDEMGHLAATFNHMKQSMKGQMDLLREKGEMERKLRLRETEALELQNRIDAGKLQLLRSQIHPHFLFNTLSVISTRAQQENAPDTVALLGALSRIFRYTLTSNEAHVPLTREVLIIRDFYTIYHARFGERIQLEWHIDPEIELTETMIPSFLIQPLVENAFHHGLAPKEEGGLVTIEMKIISGELLVCVSDNGVGISPEALRRLEAHLRQSSPPEEHIGLYNVAARLRLAGEGYHFSVENRPEGGTAVTIRMPLILADDISEEETTEKAEGAVEAE